MSYYEDRDDAGVGNWVAVEARVPLGEPYEEWHVRAVYVVTEAHPMLVDLRVRPVSGGMWAEDDEALWQERTTRQSVVREAPSGITTRLLRAISLSELERAVQSDLRRAVGGRWGDHEGTKAVERKFKPGQNGRRDDGYYAVWAKRYVDHLGSSSSPIADLARKHRLKPGQVRDRVREARVRGLLSETTRGRPGGVLTDKGLAALR